MTPNEMLGTLISQRCLTGQHLYCRGAFALQTVPGHPEETGIWGIEHPKVPNFNGGDHVTFDGSAVHWYRRQCRCECHG